MPLTETDLNADYLIETGPSALGRFSYEIVGIRPGAAVRVLCRYPHANPRFIEVENENGVAVTLPFALAHAVEVRPLNAPEAS